MSATKLQKARVTFTKSNRFLRLSRGEHFESNHVDMLQFLMNYPDKKEGLRMMAEDLVADGYYSAKCSITQVEMMLVVKLFRYTGKEGLAEWDKFAKRIGLI